MDSDTEYFVWAYAYNEFDTVYSDVTTFRTSRVLIENGYKCVDLGLSVRWATCNIGANYPEEYGDYFAWGEITPQRLYDWGIYQYCDGTQSTMTKYNTNSKYGLVDNKTTLETNDDAANKNWGGTWRIPTDTEWTELQKKCTWKWTTHNGVNGYKIISKINNNCIFLPAAGSIDIRSNINVGNRGFYWSNLLSKDYPFCAGCICISVDEIRWGFLYRYYGQSIRPVCQ